MARASDIQKPRSILAWCPGASLEMLSLSDSEDSGSGELCSTAIRKFSDEQRCYLEKLYQNGMTGWGKDHAAEVELAVAGTGLSLSQIKVCLRVNANYKKLLISCVLFSCHSLTIVTYWSSRIVDCVY